MEQATVDLPDPMEPPTAGISGADDLLAEMAGQEIERMMAEPESARAASAPPQPATDIHAPATPPEPTVAAQLDELLTEIQSTRPEEPDMQGGGGEEETSTAERGALDLAERALRSPGPSKRLREGDVAKGGLALLVRPLEWLNAPFAPLPDSIREAIGKIAILTSVNALAVLLYVFFVRRH